MKTSLKKNRFLLVFQTINDMCGDDLLRFYMNEWEKYQASLPYLRHMFRYLDRSYVQCAHNNGNNDIYDVPTVSST
jgi:hypothetical protein